MAVDVTSPHCGCGCRPPGATEQGCPCRECQPGPGVDHTAKRRKVTVMRRGRMQYLLAKDPLTADEAEELDGLLHLYIHEN